MIKPVNSDNKNRILNEVNSLKPKSPLQIKATKHQLVNNVVPIWRENESFYDTEAIYSGTKIF